MRSNPSHLSPWREEAGDGTHLDSSSKRSMHFQSESVASLLGQEERGRARS